jgi:hypothetical protein
VRLPSSLPIAARVFRQQGLARTVADGRISGKMRLRRLLVFACVMMAAVTWGDIDRRTLIWPAVTEPILWANEYRIIPYDPFDHRRRWAESPNSSLPSHIPIEPTKLTLYADYSTRGRHGSIPAYLINGTSSTVPLKNETGRFQLNLESKDVDGRWIRAQPHKFDRCGVPGLLRFGLKPGHHVRIEAYQPDDGARQLVRYSFYDQTLELSSNIGIGRASARDLALAGNNALTIWEGDIDLLAAVALGERRLGNQMDPITDMQAFAIYLLEHPRRVDPDDARRVLDAVRKKYPDEWRFGHWAHPFASVPEAIP